VNPDFYATLRHIAAAINQVPGRVLVVGHTDDQAVRSLRYRDNFELSRERAVAVVEVLKLAIDNAARLEFTGVGASQPRYTPESLPENRARNRRVESSCAGALGVRHLQAALVHRHARTHVAGAVHLVCRAVLCICGNKKFFPIPPQKLGAARVLN